MDNKAWQHISESGNLFPTIYFASNNKYDIPLLDINKQAECVKYPMRRWGRNTRRQKQNGTFNFYIDDYKFSALLKHPESIMETGAQIAIEPNFSTNNDMPIALGIYQIYCKRWLARYWQMLGINIIADLNVSEKFDDLNFVGIPEGWGAYAIKKFKDNDRILQIYEKALKHSKNNMKLFIIYGQKEDLKINALWLSDKWGHDGER